MEISDTAHLYQGQETPFEPTVSILIREWTGAVKPITMSLADATALRRVLNRQLGPYAEATRALHPVIHTDGSGGEVSSAAGSTVGSTASAGPASSLG